MSVDEGTAVGVAPDWEAADATGDWRGSAECIRHQKGASLFDKALELTVVLISMQS